MDKKGFIFDLDGVIVDTARYHYMAWKRLAESLGISFSKVKNEQLKGVSRVRSLEKILNWGNMELTEAQFNELLELKNNDYLAYIERMDKDEILPDVPRVLSFLKQNDQPIALGSASKNARTILKEVDLLEVFDEVIDGTNVTNAKPDPEVFLKAAEGLGMDPSDCIVFEDSVAGIRAANTGGMMSIGIGDPAVLHEATYVFKDFTEISNEFFSKLISE
ncbi:MAG: beta-phosphoglucomutase [Bacteroidia bacterium]|nr:beta-phosphoglucomutase [Bacteroidia bacterium]NNF31256.1 beta-phosphoglucomutase [Flavobacteriaceae bacterium]MBT8275882.1 beta-phosphoglucomutase [Bacteroidia bacterium]NNJ82941.1 beta-phosphoglucomutase [Flavobacteriaceae bacterium]NNK54549.1 beta-phosphoglucomutase [Flavobacteriaceae bacterium]